MITIAFLAELNRNPQAAYPEYGEVRDEARRRAARPVDPRTVHRYQQVMTAHGTDWCERVLGRALHAAHLGLVSGTESEQLMIAHERGLDPAEPAWLTEWKADTAEHQRRQDEIRDAGLRRDRERWATALETCGIPRGQLEVRENTRSSSQVRHGRRQALLHVVPGIDVRSARRRHHAGRALCESAQRARPLELGEPVDDPATCVSCIRYTAEIRPAAPPEATP